MESRLIDIPPVALSVWVYQMLLKTYPVRFQREYGSHMLQVFRDYCLRAISRSGTNGLAKLWVVTLLDLVQSVVSEHLHKEIEMKKEMKPEDIRRAGWMLMAGGVIFVSAVYSVQIAWELAISLYFLSMILLVFGLLGLRNRYSEKVGGWGVILLLGVILGSLTSIVGLIGTTYVDEDLGFYIFAGPAVLFICLSVFGLGALITKPLPRWNVLPLIAGLGYPIFFVATACAGKSNATKEVKNDLYQPPTMFVMFVVHFGTGYLWSRSLGRRSGIPNNRIMNLSGGFAFALGVVGVILALPEFIQEPVDRWLALFKGVGNLEFGALFAPWIGLIAGFSGLVLGLSIREWKIALKLFGLGFLSGLILYLAIMFTMQTLGFKVGSGRPVMLPTTFLSMWTVALVGSAIFGKVLATSKTGFDTIES